MKVLIADDFDLIREGIAGDISGWAPRAQVFEVSDGSEALEILGRNSIDLIITDIGMDPMDGLELIRRVRETDSSVTIFAMSGTLEDLVRAKQLGANKIFLKGRDSGKMDEAIENFLKSAE